MKKTIEERLLQANREIIALKKELNRLSAYERETVWRLTEQDLESVALERFGECRKDLVDAFIADAHHGFSIEDWAEKVSVELDVFEENQMSYS